MSEAALFDYLPDPALMIFSGGQTGRVNMAARDLAALHGLKADLVTMFGKDTAALVARARREDVAVGFLPLRTGKDGAPIFRLAVRRISTTERYTVLLADMSREFAWREQLAARNRALTVLNDNAAALSSSIDIDTLAAGIYEQTSRIMDTVNFYIALHDAEAGTLSFPIYVEKRERKLGVPTRPFGTGLTEHVILSRRPLLLNGDVGGQARALGLQPQGRLARTWLGAPMIADGVAFGLIAIQDHEGTSHYDEHDLEVLTLIAGQAAAAVRNVRLLSQAPRASQEISETQAGLLETERLRGVTETVGALNHEINNPLSAIAGNAQLLLRDPESLPDGVAEKVGRILEATRRIQAVTGKMANLIHATSKPYPGDGTILDVSRSLAREENDASPEPLADAGGDAATDEAAEPPPGESSAA
jgi:signal transduction histidine kinase